MSPERYPYNRDAPIADLYPTRYLKCEQCGCRVDEEENHAPAGSIWDVLCEECTGKAMIRSEIREGD